MPSLTLFTKNVVLNWFIFQANKEKRTNWDWEIFGDCNWFVQVGRMFWGGANSWFASAIFQVFKSPQNYPKIISHSMAEGNQNKTENFGTKGGFLFLWIMIPNAISFHAVVVLVLVFLVLFRLPLTMLWMNLLYFASMYFRSGTFKTSYLPKGYFMYLRQKMWAQVRNSSQKLQKKNLCCSGAL